MSEIETSRFDEIFWGNQWQTTNACFKVPTHAELWTKYDRWGMFRMSGKMTNCQCPVDFPWQKLNTYMRKCRAQVLVLACIPAQFLVHAVHVVLLYCCCVLYCCIVVCCLLLCCFAHACIPAQLFTQLYSCSILALASLRRSGCKASLCPSSIALRSGIRTGAESFRYPPPPAFRLGYGQIFCVLCVAGALLSSVESML